MIYTNNQMILRDYIKNESKKSSMIHSEAEYFEYFSAQQILKNYDLDELKTKLEDLRRKEI